LCLLFIAEDNDHRPLIGMGGTIRQTADCPSQGASVFRRGKYPARRLGDDRPALGRIAHQEQIRRRFRKPDHI
tara:strand:- start:91 stop:309 length:219 start_codon:yes stop_codon:yes gene_type:complete